MILVSMALLVLIGAGAVALAAKSGRLGRPHSSVLRAGFQLGTAIAVARVAILWGALVCYQDADWRQGVGYGLLVLDSLVELALLRSLRGHLLWGELLTVLVVVTSLALGVLWIALARAFRTQAGRTA